jgi:predicted HicB family RNase H-like nuclease
MEKEQFMKAERIIEEISAYKQVRDYADGSRTQEGFAIGLAYYYGNAQQGAKTLHRIEDAELKVFIAWCDKRIAELTKEFEAV